MLLLVRLVGLLILGLGVYFVINPEKMKAYFNFWKKDKRIYWIGGLRILIGILFIKASSFCKWDIFIMILGILVLIKGIMIFVLGKDRVIKIVEKWVTKPEDAIRRLAVIAVTLGVLILFAI